MVNSLSTYGHQTGRESGIRWWRRVKVTIRESGVITSIETATPSCGWSSRDYADLPDASGLQIGDMAPEEIRAKALLWAKFSAKLSPNT